MTPVQDAARLSDVFAVLRAGASVLTASKGERRMAIATATLRIRGLRFEVQSSSCQ
jgi:hypothetical protein